MRSLPEGKPDELTWHIDQVPLLIVGITEAALVGGFLWWAFRGSPKQETKPKPPTGGGGGGGGGVVDTSEGPLYYDPYNTGGKFQGWESEPGDRQEDKKIAFEAFTKVEKEMGTEAFYKDMDRYEAKRIEWQSRDSRAGAVSGGDRQEDRKIASDAFVKVEKEMGTEAFYKDMDVIEGRRLEGLSTVTVNPGLASSTIKVDLPPQVNFGSWRNVE